MYKTVIITTGDELLYGTTADTNSAYISSRLFGTDFSVIKHISVGDNLDSIVSVLSESLSCADQIITTGGLGPTDDDNTVEAVCRLLNISQVTDIAARNKISSFFSSMDVRINEKDYKMAAVPENCDIIANPVGLAPGFICTVDKKILISLPGVPAEAEKMFDEGVLPYLMKNFHVNTDNRLTFKMTGIRESDINSIINSLEIPEQIKWGITSKSGLCDLIFVSDSPGVLHNNGLNEIINSRFKDYLIGEGFSTPEQELIYLLKKNRLTISTAESCTGGLLSKRLTDISGSSEVYTGSVIAYHNSIKSGILEVPVEVINRYGAVSEEVAAKMAEGIKNLFKTDIGVSVSGIAGPGGGTKEKPVGTVCFGFCIKDSLITKKKLINGDRNRIRTFSTLYMINFLRKYIKTI